MTKSVHRLGVTGLVVGLLIVGVLSAAAQGLQSRRTLGSRLGRPAQTSSQTVDAEKDREARKARAAQRSQFAAGSLTAEFERERDTLFMDIVREAEICQTNLAEYATYPYWPDAMGVVSNFCVKENCVVVDVGHHFGSWRQGSRWQGRGKKAYVVRCNLGTRKQFVPLKFVPLNRRIWGEVLGSDGFCVISRGGSHTNFVYGGVGSICCYDSDGRFEEMYDSLDKIPGMKQCFDDELKVNYAEQDRWMKAHGFAEEGSGRDAEQKLDAARTNMIVRLKALRTILSSFPQWKIGSKWYQVCDVCAEFRDPITGGGFNRSSSSGINTNDAVFVKMSERFENLGHSQDQLIAEFVRALTGLEFGSSTDTNGVLDLKFNLGSYETCTFGRGSGTGGVNRVTLIAEFEPDSEQNAIHEKLDMSLSTLLSAIGMDRDALAYNESANGGRPLQGGLRRPGGNQDWKSVRSFSQRFLISRSRQQSGEYVVTISDLLQAERERAQREAERAEQRKQLLLIQEELKRVRQAKAAAGKSECAASCVTNKQISGRGVASEKLDQCDFLLNKDFKKDAKFYLCLFSASWCGPCRAEMPRIAKTYAETLKDDPDIELIHFSRDQNDEKAMAWAKEHDVKFPVVKPKGGNPLDLHSRGIPHLFIVRADGTLLEEGHPMRIFNEEKFREIKSGKMKPRTADADLKSGECTEQVDGYTWTYRVEKGGATIVAAGGKRRCTITPSPKGDITIPSKLGGMDVTKIGSEAFCECSGITSVTFPASVKEICWRAFSECGSLASVSIPSGVTKIYPAAFSECKSLTAITVSDENTQYASRDGILFDKGMKTLVCYPGGISGEYVVPLGVTQIGSNAFSGCSGLTSVTVSDDVAQIGEWAFSGCRGLNSVKIGRGVTRMAQGPFYRCSGLTSVSVDAGNERYASRDGVLFDKGMKTLICCPSGISGEYIIPSSVTSIGIYAFDSCRKLTSVTIPDGVTSIARSVFCYSDQLTVVSVPGSVERIGDWAFSGCRGLDTVKISNGVTSIGTGMFCGCFKLTSMTMPSSVKSIKKYAFSGCRELMSVTMQGERPEVEADAFKSCDKLKAIHVPASAKSWAGMKEWQGIPLVFDAETK